MVNNSLINRAMALTMGNIFRYLPVITLTGPRQSGKTTLCRKVFASLPYANLEDASTLAEARKDPKAPRPFLLNIRRGSSWMRPRISRKYSPTCK